MGRLIKKEALRELPLALEHANRPLLSVFEAQREKARFIDEAKEGTIALALQMAKKIVGATLELEPRRLQTMYTDALSQIDGLAPGTITVHPTGVTQEFRRLAADAGFEVIEDSQLQLADCVVEASGVRVDATVKTALYLLEKALLQQV